MGTYYVEKGDRDCSSAVIDSLRTAGIPTGGASSTHEMKRCFLNTGVWEWHDMSYIAHRGDVYLKSGYHTAMCTNHSPDTLAQFSHNENGGAYGGASGDQLNNRGASAESNIRSYYDYPWDGILHYVGGDDQKLEDAVEIMEHLCTCPYHGYTMATSGESTRWGDGSGVCKVVTDSEPEKPLSVEFTYQATYSNGKKSKECTNMQLCGGTKKLLTGVRIKANKGRVKYRVHTIDKKWLPYVTGYDWDDYDNGYAGDGTKIDAIEIIYTSPSGYEQHKCRYKVAPTGEGYYPYQNNNDKNSKMDGYAGEFGKPIARLKLKDLKV